MQDNFPLDVAVPKGRIAKDVANNQKVSAQSPSGAVPACVCTQVENRAEYVVRCGATDLARRR